MRRKPVVLCILDGWGLREEKEGNAIKLAHTPNWDKISSTYPMSCLQASGEFVGLPAGQMGNSEVGHLNIGSGRIIYQDLSRINKSIEDGDFFTNPNFLKVMKEALENDKSLHLMGLLSDGGVHSHITQVFALLKMAKDNGLKKVFVHALLDGRDVPPSSALTYIDQLGNKMKELGVGEIATVAGRYYTMDRDKNWERVVKGYDAMVRGQGKTASSAKEAVEDAYKRGETDEFVLPTVIYKDEQPVAKIEDGDSIIFFNFRADRAREITRSFIDKDFHEFSVEAIKVNFLCLTEYDATFKVPIAYPTEDIKNTFGEVISREGLNQLRIAETEKYAHVTFFFNGGVEEPYFQEERILIPSPKVPTYDLQPEMSACQVKDEVVKALEDGSHDVVIINFANPDMVGHTGILAAAVKAAETIDYCLGEVVKAVLNLEGVIFVTADHGNCEQMIDPETGKPHTAHTTNPVPFIMVDGLSEGVTLADGSLRDIAPTILEVLEIKKPVEMTGSSLIKK